MSFRLQDENTDLKKKPNYFWCIQFRMIIDNWLNYQFLLRFCCKFLPELNLFTHLLIHKRGSSHLTSRILVLLKHVACGKSWNELQFIEELFWYRYTLILHGECFRSIRQSVILSSLVLKYPQKCPPTVNRDWIIGWLIDWVEFIIMQSSVTLWELTSSY